MREDATAIPPSFTQALLQRFRALQGTDMTVLALILVTVLSAIWMFSGYPVFAAALALFVTAVIAERLAGIRYLLRNRLPCCEEGSELAEADERMVLAFHGFLQIVDALRLLSGRTKRDEDETIDRARSDKDSKIKFNRARFTHLEIRKPFPVPVDMNGIEVERWDLGNDHAEPYLELLKNTTEFDRGTYLDVERYLRNNGHHEAADRVHRAMRRREQWLTDQPAKIVMMLLHSAIGYGTRRGRVLAFMLAWFLFSAFWFTVEYPQVIQITPEIRAELNAEPEDVPKDLPESCSVNSVELDDILACIQPSDGHPLYKKAGIGFAMALRYHVPLINLDYVPYLEPHGPWIWSYAMLAVAVHWILWPLLIASLIPVLIPRRE